MSEEDKGPPEDDKGLYAPPRRYERDLDRQSDGEHTRRPPAAADQQPGSPERPAGAAGAPPQSSAGPSLGDEAAPSPGESREETIERVRHEQQQIYDTTGSTMNRDVTSRRRLGRRGIAYGIAGAMVGVAAGLVIGLVAWNPLVPAALAVVGFILGALLTAERDDGAIARRASARRAHEDAQGRL